MWVECVSDLNFKSMTRLSQGILQRLTKLNVKQAARMRKGFPNSKCIIYGFGRNLNFIIHELVM